MEQFLSSSGIKRSRYSNWQTLGLRLLCGLLFCSGLVVYGTVSEGVRGEGGLIEETLVEGALVEGTTSPHFIYLVEKQALASRAEYLRVVGARGQKRSNLTESDLDSNDDSYNEGDTFKAFFLTALEVLDSVLTSQFLNKNHLLSKRLNRFQFPSPREPPLS